MTNIVNDLRLLESGARWVDSATADVLERAADEIERLQAEVASLRITLGGKTFSADVPSPIGCPMPGACAQVKEINRLKRELAEAIDRGNDWCDQALRARAERDRLREALKWFIDNDETNEGDAPLPEYGGRSWNEINAYWIDGLNRARAALKETGHG